ncbi:hypothetical protein ILYODFUR_024127 [Ilyodon furcidens]|uniref:Uncharacterized protein n=1 Tax=Ilyodon furcidens TaxID=33524 RepID=A0ABV0SZQ2_9TELE
MSLFAAQLNSVMPLAAITLLDRGEPCLSHTNLEHTVPSIAAEAILGFKALLANPRTSTFKVFFIIPGGLFDSQVAFLHNQNSLNNRFCEN